MFWFKGIILAIRKKAIKKPKEMVHKHVKKRFRPRIHKKFVCDDQAMRIIKKFGGPRNLMRAFQEVDPGNAPNASTIYRWTYAKNKGGTGGIIPTGVMLRLVQVARLYGIILHPEDLYPQKHYDKIFNGRTKV